MTSRADAPIVVISLGWGIQSFTLTAMVALGELPPVDVAIHADTTHERSETYAFAQRWTPWLEALGVRVVTVQPPTAEPINRFGGVLIPAYTRDGIVRRQCTGDWKIDPIRRWLQANRNRRQVEQWIGITVDEATRMKPANVKYITNRWPLVERGLRRADTKRWLIEKGLEVPPRSACVFCPYQSRAEWASLRGTPDWDHAVEVDELIRGARPPGDLFVHSSMMPLPMVDLRSQQDKGQMELFDSECEGICGL